MADSKTDFVLRLIDRVTAPARAMQRALKSVRSAQKAAAAGASEAQAAVTALGNAAARAGAQAARASGHFKTLQYSTAAARFKAIGGRALAGSLSELGSFSVAKPMGPVFDRAQQRKGMGFLENLRIDTEPIRKRIGEVTEKWKGFGKVLLDTPFSYVLSGIAKLGSGLFDLVTTVGGLVLKVGALGVGLGALAAGALTKAAVSMAAFGESARTALGYVTGDKSLGARAFEHGVRLAEELGLNTEETIKQLTKLRSMQFSIREGTELIKLSTDLQAITNDAQSAERALTAITQIKAKGKLQSEELVGQLAEAGVSTVLVYKELEKILKKDRAGVLKELQGGNIDAETGIEAIKRAILAKLNTGEAGQVGKDFASSTLTGLWTQLKNAPTNFALSLEKFIDIEPVKQAIRDMLAAFKGIDRSAVGTFVQKIISGFAKMTPVVIAFGEGFGQSFGKIIDALTFGGLDLERRARDAGQWLAEFFGKAIELTSKLMEVVPDAVGAFMRGLDVQGILDGLTSADWEKFGRNLAVIANALGSITSSAAKLMGWVTPDIGPLASTVVRPEDVTAEQRAAGDRAVKALKDSSPLALLSGLLNNGSALQDTLSKADRPTAPTRPGSPQLGNGRVANVGRIEQHNYISGGDPSEVRDSARRGIEEAFSSLDGAYAP